ncbi:MAG: 5'-nucleotidase C-terminal domain-containing protein [Cyanobacteria bacterium SZAS TMP-1]|nr:5'-nucleotidase C-terminal domain-containing protein [Cyanobacteria bacterium SZAS TMP-1]
MVAQKQNKADKTGSEPRLSPFFLLLILITGALLTVALPQSDAQKPGTFALTILHTNDLHSHDQSFAERGKTLGGMARMAHLIRQYRAQNPHSLTIDAGDIFQGTPFFTIYKGEVEVEMLNKAGYDLYTIGNHEFDGGGVNLAKQLEKARFEILNCNLDCKDLPALKALIKPSVVKVIEGEKVGFIGAITPDIESLSLTRDGANLKVGKYKSVNLTPERDLPWLAPIKEEVDRLTAEGVNKIVLVTHCGTEVDKIIATELPAVDAIIGGHSHTRLDTPIDVEHKDGSHTLIVQTGCYSRNLGKFDLVFDKAGTIDLARTKYKLIKVDAKTPEDADVKDYLAAKEAPVKVLRDTILSYARSDFDNNFRAMKCDSALGDLICDSFALSPEGKAEHTDVALENRGGIRSRIDKGPISLEKVEETLPFENHMVYATVTGARLRAVVEHSIDSATGGKFLDVHGLKFGWDPQADKGKRLVFILVRQDGHWQPLKDNDKYRLAMTDYSFSGGEGYDFTDAEDIHKTDKKLNVYLRHYLESTKSVGPQWPNRIVPLSRTAAEGVFKGQWGDELRALGAATESPNPKVSILTGDTLGVSVETFDKPRAVVPLEEAAIVRSNLSVEEARNFLKSETARKRLKKYTVLVVRANNGKDSRLNLVSYPLSEEELQRNLRSN